MFKYKKETDEFEVESDAANESYRMSFDEEKLKERIKSSLIDKKRKSLSINANSKACSIQ